MTDLKRFEKAAVVNAATRHVWPPTFAKRENNDGDYLKAKC